VHRQAMQSMDRGVQESRAERRNLSVACQKWAQDEILAMRYSSTGRYRYRKSTTTEVLREFDTELQPWRFTYQRPAARLCSQRP
jgi:hypothetical protein